MIEPGVAPSAATVRQVMDDVHRRAEREPSAFYEAMLDEARRAHEANRRGFGDLGAIAG